MCLRLTALRGLNVLRIAEVDRELDAELKFVFQAEGKPDDELMRARVKTWRVRNDEPQRKRRRSPYVVGFSCCSRMTVSPGSSSLLQGCSEKNRWVGKAARGSP